MGADGGVNWVKLRDDNPETRAEFVKLIEFLGLWWRNYHEDEHHEWLDSEDASFLNKGSYYFSTYGTDQYDDGNGMETLQEILSECDNCTDDTITFVDILWGALTDPFPSDGFGYGGPCPTLGAKLKYLVKFYSLITFGGKSFEKNLDKAVDDFVQANPIMNMSVVEWKNKVYKLIVKNSFGEQETWT